MAADIRLEKYVQRKVKRGRTHYYFRVARKGEKEFRRPLPDPFTADYRERYDAAHAACFGNVPLDLSDPHGFQSLIKLHKDHARYKKLSKDSKMLRNLACDLLLDTFGQFTPRDIRPVHMQALYDKLSDRPATANRRMDDISAVFAWGRTRGYCDTNPCTRIERMAGGTGYEPWPAWALKKLFTDGKPHVTQAALVAIYTGQRRGDCLTQLRPSQISDGIWTVRQGKTGTPVPVPLHPVVLAMLDAHNEAMRAAGRIDPNEPILKTSRGTAWKSGFGATWAKELERLDLHKVEPSLTFHGFRTTNATMIASAVAKSPDLYGGIERVKSMLGHLSNRMSEHYARRAVTEHTNSETIMLLPTFGNH